MLLVGRDGDQRWRPCSGVENRSFRLQSLSLLHTPPTAAGHELKTTSELNTPVFAGLHKEASFHYRSRKGGGGNGSITFKTSPTVIAEILEDDERD